MFIHGVETLQLPVPHFVRKVNILGNFDTNGIVLSYRDNDNLPIYRPALVRVNLNVVVKHLNVM